MTVQLLVVDDNAQFLDAARGLLEREGVNVVGVASTSAQALLSYNELQPDVTLVDIDLGEEDGLDLATSLVEQGGDLAPPVILISAYPEEDVAELVAGTPAIGFLPKSRLSRHAIVKLLDEATSGGSAGPA